MTSHKEIDDYIQFKIDVRKCNAAINEALTHEVIKMEAIALSHVIRLTLMFLKENPEYECLVLGMGISNLHNKDGTTIDIEDLPNNLLARAIDEFICEWDSILKITGSGIKITVNGVEEM